MQRTTLNIAAISDVHCGKESEGTLRPYFEQLPEQTDILLLCGDLTDYGLADEAKILMRELSPVRKIPILAIFGNHDYESGEIDEIATVLQENNIILLDGHSYEMEGIGIVGAKGFGGGFGRRMLEPWGEPATKAFVDATIDETLKLERALSKTRSKQRVVMLHYSPLEATVEGEPPEIYPFLGSSRLEDPINRYGAVAVVHGHAHRGAHEGRTREGIPVYNVSLPVLRRAFPDAPPFKVISVPIRENETAWT